MVTEKKRNQNENERGFSKRKKGGAEVLIFPWCKENPKNQASQLKLRHNWFVTFLGSEPFKYEKAMTYLGY